MYMCMPLIYMYTYMYIVYDSTTSIIHRGTSTHHHGYLNTGAPSKAKVMKFEWQTIKIVRCLIKILQMMINKANTNAELKHTHTHIHTAYKSFIIIQQSINYMYMYMLD